MNCPLENRNGPDLILAYASQSLETETVALFEKHMAECQPCREFAHSQETMWRALDMFEAPAISDDFDRTLYRRIEQPAGLRERLLDWFRSPVLVRRALPLAAAASLLIVAGVVWEHPPLKPSPQPAASSLSAQIEALKPEQVESALDDMEMMREFSHPVASESPDSKM